MNRSELWWAKTRALAVAVLALWGVFGFLVPALAPRLNEVAFLGFPLGFYMAAQGSPIAFVALIVLFADRQDALDRAHDVAGAD